MKSTPNAVPFNPGENAEAPIGVAFVPSRDGKRGEDGGGQGEFLNATFEEVSGERGLGQGEQIRRGL